MTSDEFDKLLNNFESENLEFRVKMASSGEEDKDRDIKTISAFCNTSGGKLIFGVKEDGSTRKVVGVEGTPQTIESNLTAKIHGQCEPKSLTPFPRFEFLKIAGHDIVIVHCERTELPCKAKGGIYVRRGSSSFKAEEQELINLYRQNADSFDSTIVHQASLEDFDLELARKTIENKDRVQIINGDIIKLLSRMRLLQIVNTEPKPTIAGLLLFGIKPQDFLPGSRIRAEAKVDPDSQEWNDIADISGNLFEQIQGFEAFVRRNIKVSARVVGFERIETQDIPTEALREAVVNAITHRDYGDTGAETQLRIRGKKVAIENPGRLISPLTVESILSENFIPKTRNPIIAEMLVRLGFMDKRGSGLKRMIYLCKEAGLEIPKIEELPSGFRVSFNGTERQISKRVSVVIPENILRNINLDKEHRKILKSIENIGSISSNEATRLLGRSKPYTLRKLNELISWKILEPTSKVRNDPNSRYTPHRNLSPEEKKLSPENDPGTSSLFGVNT